MKLSKARIKGIAAAVEKRVLRAYDRHEGSRDARISASVVAMRETLDVVAYALVAKHAMWEERQILKGRGDSKAPGKVIRA